MNLPLNRDIYKKIVLVTNTVKDKLRRKGVAIPIKNDDGSISFGSYTVRKNKDRFYSILDYSNNTIVDKINLPQTALLVANNLALGKFLDKELISIDQNYGYALFEEELETHLSRKKVSADIYSLRMAKALKAKYKKESCKKDIERSFEKLRKLV